VQLEDFYMMRLSVIWHDPTPNVKSPVQLESKYTIDYDVFRQTHDLKRFILRFRLNLDSFRTGKRMGYAIDSEILGIFRFPESIAEEEMQKIIRFNGTVILYGILRGEIAAITGSFPGGKFNLPTVNMVNIVKKVENRKKAVAASQVKQTVKKINKKKTN